MGFSSILHVHACTFYNNSARHQGGALVVVYNSTATIRNCSFISNFGEDGVVLMADRNVSLWIHNCTFDTNICSRSIISLSNHIHLHVSDCKLMKNKCKSGDILSGSNQTLVTFQNSQIIRNFGNRIIFIKMNGQLTMIDSNVNNNEGNVIHVKNGKLILKDTFFEANTARDAGSVFYTVASDVSINNCKFSNNSSILQGGVAVIGEPSIVVISDSVFQHNHATGDGGAIVSQTTVLEIHNCIMSDNTAKDAGGAISIQYGKRVLAFNVSFIRNRARLGGAVYSFEAETDVVIQSCTFSNNSVTIDGSETAVARMAGAGLFIQCDTIRISDTMFLPLYQKGLIYYSFFRNPLFHMYTYNSTILHGNFNLHTGDEAFFSEAKQKEIIVYEKTAYGTQIETPFASG